MPDELWLTDITEDWTGEGKLYACAIKDVYSSRIVGYSIDSLTKSSLAVAALNHAVARRGNVAEYVLHTDVVAISKAKVGPLDQPARHGRIDGSSLCSGRERLHGAGLQRAERAAENMSSIVAPWATREELRIAIVRWIERTYHRRRKQAGLGRLTPDRIRVVQAPTVTQAA